MTDRVCGKSSFRERSYFSIKGHAPDTHSRGRESLFNQGEDNQEQFHKPYCCREEFLCVHNILSPVWLAVTKACCRFGDDFSIIPQKHMVMEDKGLRPPFKSKWVGHVLRNAVEDTPGLTYQMMREILKPYMNKYVLTNNVLQEAPDTAKGDLFGDPDKKG